LVDKNSSNSSSNSGNALNSVTLSKDTLYGGTIVVLVALLVVSVFTQGFGVIKTECTAQDGSTTCDAAGNNNGNAAADNSAQAASDQGNALPTLQEITLDFGSYPARGDANAVVSIVEFSEFQCPYCERLYTQTEKLLESNYIDTGKVKFYFRDYPLPPQYHPQAGPAAIAARCANDQDKFWEMHDQLFDSRDEWSGSSDTDSLFKGYATTLGISSAEFDACYDAQEHSSEISADLAAGQLYGVGGTPNSFIIIPKNKVDETTLRSLVDSINSQYGGSLELYQNDNEYTVLIPGAYPYQVFQAILDEVDY